MNEELMIACQRGELLDDLCRVKIINEPKIIGGSISFQPAGLYVWDDAVGHTYKMDWTQVVNAIIEEEQNYGDQEQGIMNMASTCLLYTSDAADE